MFEKHKQAKTAKEFAVAQATWEREDNILKGLLSVIVNGGGPWVCQSGGPSDVPLMLKKGEHAVYLFAGSGLFEPSRGPGHYAGASSGFSIPIGSTGVHYRIGQSRGTFVQGDQSPTVIDTDTVVITDQRVVFMGAKRTVEWAFKAGRDPALPEPAVDREPGKQSPRRSPVSPTTRNTNTTSVFASRRRSPCSTGPPMSW